MKAASVDIVIIGSGFSGLAAAAYLKRSGRNSFVILERAQEVGGTWRDNSYPGCACDVPSHLYSFSFALNPDWSSTFSPQAEIKTYLRRTARKEGLLRHIRFGCELQKAIWDNKAKIWQLHTTHGTLSARIVISAAGPLSEPSIPDIAGLDTFPGKVFHSAQWDHSYNLKKKRVVVVGSGASAIQFVPKIQPLVAKLVIFQRTAPWIIPRADRRVTVLERAIFRYVPGAQRVVRGVIFWGRECYALPLLRTTLTPVVKAACKLYLWRQVPDGNLRKKLTPDYQPGCKRILVSSDYLPAMTQPNVSVVSSGVARVRGSTVIAADGSECEADAIIFGTGFHVTDSPVAKHIFGQAGRSLAEVWADGPAACRGTTTAGFPNLFLMLGPNTGLGHTSLVIMAEAQARYIVRALTHLDAHQLKTLEVKRAAQQQWNKAVQERMKHTVWVKGGCSSWYLDAKGRNTTLWPNFAFRFHKALSQFDPSEYRFSKK